jgi:hypothetical protein
MKDSHVYFSLRAKIAGNQEKRRKGEIVNEPLGASLLLSHFTK